MRLFVGRETGAPLLSGRNGFFHRVQVGFVPFCAEVTVRKLGTANARASQNLVHLLVVERLQNPIVDESGTLGVEQLIFYGRRFRVLINSLASDVIQQRVVGAGRVFAVFGQRGHADFQAAFVHRRVDGEDIDDLRFQRGGVCCHRLGVDLGKKRGCEREWFRG